MSQFLWLIKAASGSKASTGLDVKYVQQKAMAMLLSIFLVLTGLLAGFSLWGELGSLGYALSAFGIVLWIAGFAETFVDDWKTRTFLIHKFWLLTGIGCVFLGFGTGEWVSGLLSGAGAGGVSALNLVVSKRKYDFRTFWLHGDIDMLLAGAFPMGCFTDAGVLPALWFGVVVGLVAAVFVVFGVSFIGRQGFSGSTHFGYTIFLASATMCIVVLAF